jgi:hypothetical protein
MRNEELIKPMEGIILSMDTIMRAIVRRRI